MMVAMDARILDVSRMSAAELKLAWEKAFGKAAPPLPSSLLRRELAYLIQEQAERGLSRAVERVLERLAKDPSTRLVDPPIQLKPGTRLMREWNGRMHAVLVTDEGVLFEDQRYALSATLPARSLVRTGPDPASSV
jgi:hypothetical protein